MPAITDYLTNDEILGVVAQRLKASRLERNMTVEALSAKSGLNRNTIIDMEGGKDVRLTTMLKYMRGLGKLGALEAAFPDVLPGPQSYTSRGQMRHKAATPRGR